MLLRVSVEPAEQVRSRHLLELDGRDHAQDLIPLLNHDLVIGVASGLDLPGGAIYALAVPENIEPLAREVFEAGSIGEAQQMADGEDQFAETEGIGGVNTALHDLVMDQAVDDIGAFPLGRAEDGGVSQQVTFVAEGVGGHTLLLAEIFERVVGIQGVNAHLEFLAVAGGV